MAECTFTVHYKLDIDVDPLEAFAKYPELRCKAERYAAYAWDRISEIGAENAFCGLKPLIKDVVVYTEDISEDD